VKQRGQVRPGNYILFYEKEKKIIKWEKEFLYKTKKCHQLSQYDVELVSDTVSCIGLRGR